MTLQQAGAPFQRRESLVVRGRIISASAKQRIASAKRGARVRGGRPTRSAPSLAVHVTDRVIEAFVALGESLKKLFRFAMAIRRLSRELIGDGQPSRRSASCVRLNCEDVAADRLCLFRFVEER